MRDWCDQAESPHCGLRKAGATIAAENGATDEPLMAIFGWTTKQQTTHYTRKAQRRRMAEHAINGERLPPLRRQEGQFTASAGVYGRPQLGRIGISTSTPDDWLVF
jgi:hypothetical protein